MKKLSIILVIVILFFLGIIFWESQTKQGTNLYTFTLNGKKLHLLIADNETEWEKGLMYYRKLDNADGMIFLFPDKQYRTFWNKNTFMDLNLYWINGETVIGKSELPSIEKSKQIVTVNSPGIADKVIEMPKK